MKKLKDSEISLKNTKKLIASTFTIIENQLVRAKS